MDVVIRNLPTPVSCAFAVPASAALVLNDTVADALMSVTGEKVAGKIQKKIGQVERVFEK